MRAPKIQRARGAHATLHTHYLGKQLQSVIDEALRDFIDKHKRGKPRPEVLTALGESLAEYDALYRELAK